MLLYYALATLSVLLYMHGFFPIPPRINPDFALQNRTLPSKFRRGILIVIDALRLDFVEPHEMPFLTQTMHSSGCFVNLKVEAPTVTLPRIKALTTGSVPQFIDIITNLASPEILEDSFVHRARARSKKIVFYGDDIWLKLFPASFERSEGTTSFFVNDFYEVDHNVTRNVKRELKNRDWDIMVLHYLGLDHIGHVFGPKSPLIAPKLLEMDSVIEDIYKSTSDTHEPFFIFITGDHGMRDSGGHGGSTHPETNVPLVVLGIDCSNDSFTQIDVPVNFNTLLGIETPSTSIGLLQDSILEKFTLIEYLEASKTNLELLKSKTDLNDCRDRFEEAKLLHDLFVLRGDQNLGTEAKLLYENCAREINEKLLKSSINQNVLSLLLSTIAILFILAKIVRNFTLVSKFDYLEETLMVVIVVLQFLKFEFGLSAVLIIISFVLLIKNLIAFRFKKYGFFVCLLLLHPLTFLSSSFLEEEHQFWYFFSGNLLLILGLTRKDLKSVCMFVGLRFLRTLNQVGDQFASSPDFADFLLKPENRLIRAFIFTLALTLIICLKIKHKKPYVIADSFILITIFTFRLIFNDNISCGKLIWLLISLRFFCFNIYHRDNILSVWILIVALLVKPENLLLLPACVAASDFIKSQFKCDYQILILSHFWLGQVFFFLHGHDNSLASVDISSGYVGLSDYNPIFVFPQVLCHTFAFPVLSHLLLLEDRRVDRKKFFVACLGLRLYILVVVFAVTFVHRNHLFIWSVFAPKVFVEGSHFGALVLEALVYYVTEFVNKMYKY